MSTATAGLVRSEATSERRPTPRPVVDSAGTAAGFDDACSPPCLLRDALSHRGSRRGRREGPPDSWSADTSSGRRALSCIDHLVACAGATIRCTARCMLRPTLARTHVRDRRDQWRMALNADEDRWPALVEAESWC